MRSGKKSGVAGTALGSVWSEQEYLRWQRDQDERDEEMREGASMRVLMRFDPECEAAVWALEEGWGCQSRLDKKR